MKSKLPFVLTLFIFSTACTNFSHRHESSPKTQDKALYSFIANEILSGNREIDSISFYTKLHPDVDDYKSYLDIWKKRVEKVGSRLFYSNKRLQKFSGSLIIDVVVNSDGTIRDIAVLKSSGDTFIDNEVKNIIRLCQPFSAFPEKIKKETDVLHIVRTWKFVDFPNGDKRIGQNETSAAKHREVRELPLARAGRIYLSLDLDMK